MNKLYMIHQKVQFDWIPLVILTQEVNVDLIDVWFRLEIKSAMFFMTAVTAKEWMKSRSFYINPNANSMNKSLYKSNKIYTFWSNNWIIMDLAKHH